MKPSNHTRLGAAIVAALLSTSAAAEWHPPLLLKGAAVELEQPSDRLIVKFREGSAAMAATSARDDALARIAAGARVSAKAGRRLAVGADVVHLDRKLDRVEMEILLTELRDDPTVEYAGVDHIKQIAWVPNDAQYVDQWHYFNATGGLNLPTAWNKSKGSGVVVAVLDTGYTVHPDLNFNRLQGHDFISTAAVGNDGGGRDTDARDTGDWVAVDECSPGSSARTSSWHGTHVAGTIAATTNNTTGVAGAAPLAKFVPVRVLGKCGGYTSDIADAIIWASGGVVAGAPVNANPAEVINMSLGGAHACDAPTQAAIDQAVGNGTVVVVAAGNSNSSVAYHSPANCNNVITVASNDASGLRSTFSNSGPAIDITAPGGAGPGGFGAILSTSNAGTAGPGAANYTLKQGTSMATPHVAAVVALMQAANLRPPADVESILKRTAIVMPPASCPGMCGGGRMNAANAVNAAIGPVPAAVPVLLRNGVAQAVNAGGVGVERRFTLSTFADVTNLSVALAGGTGNADLYVRLGTPPTTSVYDCASTGGTNTESCPIASPVLGTYHVLVRGVTAHSGASVTATFNTESFTNKNDLHIPDNNVAFVGSPIFVHGQPGNAPSNLQVQVFVYHAYSGDVTLQLRAPDGTIYPLPYAGGSSDNIIKTFTIDASSEVANGVWQLQANDTFATDAGHIDTWVLRF